MKLIVTLTPDNCPEFATRFIQLWKTRKGYPDTNTLTLGEALELHIAVTYTLYHEDSDTRFFNNVLQGAEFAVAWDGDELIDIVLFDICELLKKRLSHSRTFSDEIGID